MAPRTAAEHARLKEAGLKTDDAAGAITTIRNMLEGHTAELRAGWDGDSARSFENVFGIWRTEMTNVINELVGLSEKLGRIEERYRATHQIQAAETNKLAAQINQ
ncbi:WXG100 family type VII secretion target [Thermocatellispora tengchongensis]|uniref:ESAT-6-like protein n=1 Tax=Thermocatellispora tengchongensis TaxID=1073253 RepID=A0A840PGB7_9ACTN|nr:WXG100 family type VII secretion target [Thermocatellispora tengchongensis]MBB5138192.1 WXG100 family type VII secretion target [Thermocatellispora tengchongensis]